MIFSGLPGISIRMKGDYPSLLVRGRLKLHLCVGFILYLDKLIFDSQYGSTKGVAKGFD